MWLHRLLPLAAAGTAVAAFAAPVNAAGTLVADWEMNETSGTTMVDSAGNNTGTLQNITPNGSYYAFNGVDSLATATQNFAIGSANITFTARLRFGQVPSSTVGDYDVVRGAPTGRWKMEIVRRNSGTQAKANCHFAGTRTGTNLARGPSLADGKWHTVTCTKTATTVSLTVDGTTYTTSVSVGDINTTGKQIALGGQATGADQYMGDLDYVQVKVG